MVKKSNLMSHYIYHATEKERNFVAAISHISYHRMIHGCMFVTIKLKNSVSVHYGCHWLLGHHLFDQ